VVSHHRHAELEAVAHAEGLTQSDFERAFVSRCRPVVLAQFLGDSPLRTWSLAYFGSRARSTKVPMYTRSHTCGAEMSRFTVTMVSAQAYAAAVVARSRDHAGSNIGCRLDEVLPALAAEIPPCPLADPRRHIVCELFSGLDYATDGHCHSKAHGILCQIEGEKTVVLYPPEDAPLLYPHPVYTEEYFKSRVDFLRVDHPTFPLATKARRHLVRLRPGDALFIPVGFWHAVEGVGVSTSMSYFWKARTRDHRSLRTALRNELGWALDRTVERLEPVIGKLPWAAKRFLARHYPTSVNRATREAPADRPMRG
jgi:hypothetical protein